jgi:excinuclease ABC subunit B
MNAAINETNRRRAKQLKYNEENGIVPVSIHKAIRDLTDQLSADAKEKAMAVGESKADYRARHDKTSRNELQKIIAEMEKRMKDAARNLEFEKAAALRDEMYELRGILADEADLKPWERIKLLAGEE